MKFLGDLELKYTINKMVKKVLSIVSLTITLILLFQPVNAQIQDIRTETLVFSIDFMKNIRVSYVGVGYFGELNPSDKAFHDLLSMKLQLYPNYQYSNGRGSLILQVEYSKDLFKEDANVSLNRLLELISSAYDPNMRFKIIEEDHNNTHIYKLLAYFNTDILLESLSYQLSKRTSLTSLFTKKWFSSLQDSMVFIDLERKSSGEVVGYFILSGVIDRIRHEDERYHFDVLETIGVESLKITNNSTTIIIILPTNSKDVAIKTYPEANVTEKMTNVYFININTGILKQISLSFTYDFSETSAVSGIFQLIRDLENTLGDLNVGTDTLLINDKYTITKSTAHNNFGEDGKINHVYERQNVNKNKENRFLMFGIGLEPWHVALIFFGLLALFVTVVTNTSRRLENRVSVVLSVSMISILLLSTPLMPLVAKNVNEQFIGSEFFFTPRQFEANSDAIREYNLNIVIPSYKHIAQEGFLLHFDAHIVATTAIKRPYNLVNPWDIISMVGFDRRVADLAIWLGNSGGDLFGFLKEMVVHTGATSTFIPGEMVGVNTWILFTAEPTEIVDTFTKILRILFEIGKNLIGTKILAPIGIALITIALVSAAILAFLVSHVFIRVSASYPFKVGNRVVSIGYEKGQPKLDGPLTLHADKLIYSIPVIIDVISKVLTEEPIRISNEKPIRISKLVPLTAFIQVPSDSNSGWVIQDHIYIFSADNGVKVAFQFHDIASIWAGIVENIKDEIINKANKQWEELHGKIRNSLKEILNRVKEKLDKMYDGELPPDPSPNDVAKIGVKQLPELWKKQVEIIPETDLKPPYPKNVTIKPTSYPVPQIVNSFKQDIEQIRDRLRDAVGKVESGKCGEAESLTSEARAGLNSAKNKIGALPIPPMTNEELKKYIITSWNPPNNFWGENPEYPKLKQQWEREWRERTQNWTDTLDGAIKALEELFKRENGQESYFSKLCKGHDKPTGEDVAKHEMYLIFVVFSATPAISDEVVYSPTHATITLRAYYGWNPMPGIIQAIIDRVRGIFNIARAIIYNGLPRATVLLNNLQNKVNEIIGDSTLTIKVLLDLFLKSVIETMLSAIQDLIQKIIKEFMNKLTDIKNKMADLESEISKAISDASSLELLNLNKVISMVIGKIVELIASTIIENFKNEIEKLFNRIENRINSIIDEILDKINNLKMNIRETLDSVLNYIDTFADDINGEMTDLDKDVRDVLAVVQSKIGSGNAKDLAEALEYLNRAEAFILSKLYYIRDLTIYINNVFRLPIIGRDGYLKARIIGFEKVGVSDHEGNLGSFIIEYGKLRNLPGWFSETYIILWMEDSEVPVPVDFSLIPNVGPEIENLRKFFGAESYSPSVVPLKIYEVAPLVDGVSVKLVNLGDAQLSEVRLNIEIKSYTESNGCTNTYVSFSGGSDPGAKAIPRLYIPGDGVFGLVSKICNAV